MTHPTNLHARLLRLDESFWCFLLRTCLKQLAHRRGPMHRLSQREGEVWDLYTHGMSLAEIARYLTIEYSTVRTHLRSARKKLGLSGASQHEFKVAYQDQATPAHNKRIQQ